MLKLAICEEFMDVRRQFRENKAQIFLILFLVLMAVLRYNLDKEDFPYGYWIMCILTMMLGVSQYGREQIFPQIFSYVPMDAAEKKRYILYRTFGGCVFLWLLAAAVSQPLLLTGKFAAGHLLAWMYVWLLVCSIKGRVQFYELYKRMTGQKRYPGITRSGKILFGCVWFVDIAMVLLGFFFLSDEATDFLVPPLPVALLYLAVSYTYHIIYLKRSLAGLELE